MKYVWSDVFEDQKTAGSKARSDIVHFVRGHYAELIYQHGSSKAEKLYNAVANWIKFPFAIRRNSTLLVQYPLYSGQRAILRTYKNLLNLRVEMLVHDLDFLRGKGTAKSEIKTLCVADYLVSQNNSMTDRLLSQNIKPNSEIIFFDYMVESQAKESAKTTRGESTRSNHEHGRTVRVLIAGNLALNKAAYIYELQSIPAISFVLYGINYDEQRQTGTNTEYRGSFAAARPPTDSGVDFGLVWDGESITGCTGAAGEYLKINSPHKASLYLSMGIPLIAWTKSALATEIERAGIGFTVDELADIPEKLGTCNVSEMKKNAAEYGKKIRTGEFIKTALKIK